MASSHAVGMPAISRRLSAATPPEARENTRHPNGMPVRVVYLIGRLDRLLASLLDTVRCGHIPVVSLRSTTVTAAMPPASEPATA